MNDLTAILEAALTHQQEGRLDQAETIYRKVLKIDPSDSSAIHLLGTLMQRRGNFDEAISLIGKAILLSPKVADYHANIAAVYLAAGRPLEAASHAKTALKIDADNFDAAYNLGNALFALGDVEASVKMFQRSLELDPANQACWTNYLFTLNFSPDATPADIWQANRLWGEGIEEAREGAEVSFATTGKPGYADPDRQLNLAYFLPELDQHVTTRFIEPVLSAHDREQFSVFVYGDRTDARSPPSAIGDSADHWIDTHGLSDRDIARQMRGDGIDVLAHPCTFKARYRTVLAHRAAPVQIACTNLVSTTGLEDTDYLITDGFISPDREGEAYFTEQLIRLTGFNIYKSFDAEPEPGPLPAAESGLVTFGSFNNIAKLTGRVVAVWSEILTAVEGSRLLLKNGAFDDVSVRHRTTERFFDQGIAADRLLFEGFTQDPAGYLSAYQRVDISLDPFPFGGGTTSYEAIWMGVPVLTLAGDTFMGRLSGSLMHRLDLPEFVVDSKAEYIAAARLLASDVDRLGEIRCSLRHQAQATIFNAERHVAELEAAYRDAWLAFCET